MNSTDPLKQNSYEAWLGNDAEVRDLWQTKTGETFAVMRDSVHLPTGIGPLDGEQDVEFENLTEYGVSVDHESNTGKVALPFVIGSVLCAGGIYLGAGLGVLLIAVGLLGVLAGLVAVVQERSNVTAHTHVTIYMGKYSATVTIEDDVSEEVHDVLNPHLPQE